MGSEKSIFDSLIVKVGGGFILACVVFIIFVGVFGKGTNSTTPQLSESASGCSVSFDENVIQLGRKAEQVTGVKGPNPKVYNWEGEGSGKSEGGLYDRRYAKVLSYSDGINVEMFYLDQDKNVVGYDSRYSRQFFADRNYPNYEHSVKDSLSWAGSVSWGFIHKNTAYTSPSPWVNVYATCGDNVISVNARCFPFVTTNIDTNSKQLTWPSNFLECKYEGLSVWNKNFFVRNSGIPVQLDFSSLGKPANADEGLEK